MDAEELLKSIEQYKNELDKVNIALLEAEGKEKSELEELQLNLVQILELTLSQLDDKPNRKEEVCTHESEEDKIKSEEQKKIDDEFELFKLEISQLEATNGPTNVENAAGELTKSGDEKFLSDLKELEGQEVRAPFVEPWGGHSYHNAVVLSLVVDEDGNPDMVDPKVLVLYSHPTSISMLACRFFLDGRCNYDSQECKFSHGVAVAVEDLKEYSKPNRELIVAGSQVLALHKEDIWHKGSVEDVLENRAGFSFSCFICKEVVEVDLESMIPLSAAEKDQYREEEYGVTSKSVQPQSDNEGKNGSQAIMVPSDMWLQNSLSSKLGEWEKHTKGIGSKLMAQMGYVVGTGLGPNGEGRVEPVTVNAYPQGVSLDRCMELRIAGNGKDLFQIDKSLLKQQKKEEKRKKDAENLKLNSSVFDIINNKLCKKESAPSGSTQENGKQKVDVSKLSLKKDSAKELNRKNFTLSSHILQLEKEVKKLQRSKERQVNDKATVRAVDLKIQENNSKLRKLRDAEKNITTEQESRKNNKKFCLF